MGPIQRMSERARLGALVFGASMLVHCDACESDDPAHGEPGRGPALALSPVSITRAYRDRFKVQVLADCHECRTTAPYVVEVTHESSVVGFVAATSTSDEATLESYVSPARTRLTFTPSRPGAPGRADLEIACEQIGKAKMTARFLETANDVRSPTDLTSTIDVECTRPPDDAGGPQTREPKEFANGVGELVSVARSGAAFTFAIGGVTSNFGERPKNLVEKFTPIDDDCERFEGATDFPSEKGPDSVSAETSLQKGTAAFDSMQMRYVWSGFQAGPLFGTDDSVKFAWGGIEEIVSAPPPFRAPAEVLSAPNGAATEFYVSPAEATTVTVFGQLAPGAGYTCRYPVNQLRVISPERSAIALVPAPVVLAMPDVMAQLQNVFVAQMNEKRTTRLFEGRDRALDVARMLRIPRSALDP